MTPDDEYRTLLRVLPKDLMPEELARFRTSGYPFPNPAQMMIKTAAVCRDGHWHGVIIFIHSRGVAGHQVLPQWRQHKADAIAIADQVVERIQDQHEAQTGVRNRGTYADDDDNSEMPCP